MGNIEKERRSHKFCNHIYGMFHMNVNRNIRKLLSLMLFCTCSVPVFPGGAVTDGSIFAVQGNSPEEGGEEEITTEGGIEIPTPGSIAPSTGSAVTVPEAPEISWLEAPSDNSDGKKSKNRFKPGNWKLSLKQRGKGVMVSWKSCKEAVRYEVYLIRNGKKKRWGITKKNRVFIKFDAGVFYQVQVFGKNKKGKKAAKSGKVSLFLPKEVEDISMCSLGKEKVRICWKKTQRAEKYMIYRKEKGEQYQKLARTAKLSYVDDRLEYGRVYHYKIVPVTKKNFSGTAAVKAFQNKKIVAVNHQKYTYEEMEKDIKMLQNKYQGLLAASVIGKSEDGRNLYDVVIGNKNADKVLLVVSTLHAREYMASLLCMNQIEYYLQNYGGELEGKKVKEVLKNIAIHYIPMANPDGVAISQFGIGALRKASLRQKLQAFVSENTQVWKANARGVDLNRNFPYQFQSVGEMGSEGFSGTAALSESETRAVLELIKNLQKKKTISGAVNYHAMGSIVFGSCPKKNRARDVTKSMYSLARSVTGYAGAAGYSSGKDGNIGNLREYFIFEKEIPSITLEIGNLPCPGPISEFSSIWDKNKTLVFLEAALLSEVSV